MLHTDICIAGAGVVGLSLALELQSRNLSVTVVEAGEPLREASWAAAGMLAARDPHNPDELSALADLSLALYPHFLSRLEELGGMAVPFQTSRTLQSMQPPGVRSSAPLSDAVVSDLLHADDGASAIPAGFEWLKEHSIDPRQLADSLLPAIAATPIHLLTGCRVISTRPTHNAVQIATSASTIEANHFIDCTGSWAKDPAYGVIPVKGQMLAVALPSHFPMKATVRTADIYIVPRTAGAMAGRAIIGATVEDAGFDKTIDPARIEDLRRKAIALLPQLAHAQAVDAWSGLRPATADRLPIIGPHPAFAQHWVASGHYRNGILLAPATAHAMAQMLVGETPTTSLARFAPSRFSLPEVLLREALLREALLREALCS